MHSVYNMYVCMYVCRNLDKHAICESASSISKTLIDDDDVLLFSVCRIHSLTRSEEYLSLCISVRMDLPRSSVLRSMATSRPSRCSSLGGQTRRSGPR